MNEFIRFSLLMIGGIPVLILCCLIIICEFYVANLIFEKIFKNK